MERWIRAKHALPALVALAASAAVAPAAHGIVEGNGCRVNLVLASYGTTEGQPAGHGWSWSFDRTGECTLTAYAGAGTTTATAFAD